MKSNNLLYGRLLLDSDLYIISADEKFCELLGYTANEFALHCPMYYGDIIDPDESEDEMRIIRNMLKKNAVAVVSHHIMRKDSALMSVVLNIEAIEDNTIVAMIIFDSHEITNMEFSRVSTIPFTYDFHTDVVLFSKEYERLFKRSRRIEDFRKTCRYNPNLAADSCDIIENFFMADKAQIQSGSFNISLLDAYGEYRWFTLSVRCTFDNKGAPLKSTGFLMPAADAGGKLYNKEDIGDIEYDTPGIYKKNAMEMRVKRQLTSVSAEKPAALMLIKLDNMVEVNIKLGRFAVDTIIHDFLFRLLSDFGQNIIGRFGGINYAMYIENCGTDEEVSACAKKIREIIRNVVNETASPVPITLSIGTAIIKKPVAYQDLYNSTEDALSSAISMGGNTYMVYSDSIEGERFLDSTENAENRVSEYVTGDMWSSFIDKLYSGDDWSESIRNAIAFVGNIFKVDRITVVEIPGNKHFTHRVIQWTREGVKNTSEMLSKMDISSMYYLLTRGNYDESGVIFCCYDVMKYEDIYRDIFSTMDIRSFVQCRIYDGGTVIGYISMEVAKDSRVWFKQEIDFLRLMSKLIGRNISAKNALNTVEKLNDRIQTVIDNVDSSIYVIDKYNFNILYYNDSFAKKIGEIPDSKRPCYELIHGNKAPCDFCPLAELEGSQENQNISMVMNNFGIYKETVDVIASEMQWENAQAYIINISEHLESPEEAERRKQQEHIEKKYAFVYSHSCETIIDINVEKGNVHYTVIRKDDDSNSVENYKEDDYSDSFARWVRKYVHPDDRRKVRSVFSFDGIHKNIGRRNFETKIEYRCVYPDGTMRWKEAHGFYIDSDKSYVIARSDITDRKLAEEAATFNKKTLYTAIFNVYKKVLLVNLTDDEYTILNADDSEELYGSYSTYLDVGIENRYRPEDIDEIRKKFFCGNLLAEFENGESHVESETRRYNDAGELHWVSVQAINVHNDYDDKKRAIVLIRNIDQQKQTEVVLREAYNSAESANSAKSDFLSRMSHEIRTPMNAIIGMTQIAKNSLDNPAQVSNCLDKMDISAQYLLSLINDILDMSRIESGKMVIANNEFDFSGFVEEIRTLIIPQAANKGLEFDIVTENISSSMYIGDATRIKQVIINLISNSLKFTKRGGKITLTICEKSIAEENKAMIKFIVADTGIGMSKDFLEKMYRPFEQESASNVAKEHGTGLGLAITKNLVYLMGGHIEVRSELGVGTEFEIEFKLGVSKSESNRKKPEKTGDDYDFSGKNVLAVEDNEINMEIICALLESKNFNVVSAENGVEAVKRFTESEDGFFDVIVMDIMMPVMNGLEASSAIRSLDRTDAKEIPIIAMTANAFDDDVSKSIAHGMNDHLAKPVQPDKLFATLGMYLGC